MGAAAVWGGIGGSGAAAVRGLAVDVAAHLLNQAFRELPDGDPEILADAVVMMDRFLFGQDAREARRDGRDGDGA